MESAPAQSNVIHQFMQPKANQESEDLKQKE